MNNQNAKIKYLAEKQGYDEKKIKIIQKAIN